MISIIESLRGHSDSAPIPTETGYAFLSGKPLFCRKTLLEAKLGMPTLCVQLPGTDYCPSPPISMLLAHSSKKPFQMAPVPIASLPRQRLLSRSPGVVLSKATNLWAPDIWGLFYPLHSPSQASAGSEHLSGPCLGL